MVETGGKTGKLAAALGQGAFAGLIGTAAMALLQGAEVRARGQRPSRAPAKTLEEAVDAPPLDPRTEERLSNALHFGYGAGWGAVGGLLATTALTPVTRTALHFGLVWGTALLMGNRRGVSPPPKPWGPLDYALDALNHAVYAGVTGAVLTAAERQGAAEETAGPGDAERAPEPPIDPTTFEQAWRAEA